MRVLFLEELWEEWRGFKYWMHYESEMRGGYLYELVMNYYSSIFQAVLVASLAGFFLFWQTQHSVTLSGDRSFYHTLTHLEVFLTSCCLLWFGTRPHGAEVWMWRLDMLLTSAVSFILLWQLLHGFLLSFLSYYPFLAICPSLPFSEVHFSLSSAPIPLPSPCHPDVNAFIMWNTCTPCWSLSPPLLCPSPFSGYCDYRVCVCVCVYQRVPDVSIRGAIVPTYARGI